MIDKVDTACAVPGSTPDERLAFLGITLEPVPALPAIIPILMYRQSGDLLWISGRGPLGDRAPRGKIGRDLTEAEGYEAARLTAVQMLAGLKDELQDLDRIHRWVKVNGFVNCVEGFTAQSKVVNGFSDLIVKVYGERGQHARTACGASSLPFDVPVEIEAIVQVDNQPRGGP